MGARATSCCRRFGPTSSAHFGTTRPKSHVSGSRSAAAIETLHSAARGSPVVAMHPDETERAMRMFLKVQMEVDAATRTIKDGSMAKLVEDFTEAAKPEGIWFTALDGKRTMVAVFDLATPAEIPPLAEPFFTALN